MKISSLLRTPDSGSSSLLAYLLLLTVCLSVCSVHDKTQMTHCIHLYLVQCLFTPHISNALFLYNQKSTATLSDIG